MDIVTNLNNPEKLELLYRSDKSAFRESFNELKPELGDSYLVRAWDARLNYEKSIFPKRRKGELKLILLLAFVAGLFAKFPALFGLNEEQFYLRNAGFIVLPALGSYFLYRKQAGFGLTAILTGIVLAALTYINSISFDATSDTFVLSLVHILPVLWGLAGIAFVGSHKNIPTLRLNYLHYNGDLIVMSTLIGLAGMILTGMTIGLFELIGIDIVEFYFENVVLFCLPAIPILGTFLIKNNPHLVGKISPMIARIFSPIVLIMLIIYLFAMVYSGKEDPYNDREFLLLFNFLLIGVMALIVFSLAGRTEAEKNKFESITLFLLSVITISVNGIALSAILFRIINWGITPNRAAVLGSNVLILINLLWVAFELFRALRDQSAFHNPGKVIARYLPVYVIWAVVVAFIFPLLFGMK